MDRSTELKLVAEKSLSELFSRLPFLNGPPLFLILFCDKCSPHKFEPPCVYGMFSNAIPCKWGPLANSNETPSHYYYYFFYNNIVIIMLFFFSFQK